MFGFLIGGISLVALIAVLKRGGRYRHFGSGWHRRDVANAIYDRLGTSIAQERVISAAADELTDAALALQRELELSRADIAAALRTERFDAAAMNVALSRHEQSLAQLRQRGVSFFATVHETLEPAQRTTLARLVESRFAPCDWAGSHFHSGCHYRSRMSPA